MDTQEVLVQVKVGKGTAVGARGKTLWLSTYSGDALTMVMHSHWLCTYSGHALTVVMPLSGLITLFWC